MKTEIPVHIVKTLKEVTAEIEERQKEIQQLLGIRSGLMELYEVPASLPIGNLEKPEPRAKKPAKPAPVESGRAPSGDTVKLMAVIRNAPEPFTMESLRVASGMETKFIANTLARFHSKGWLERAGRGEYKRSATFPHQAPAQV